MGTYSKSCGGCRVELGILSCASCTYGEEGHGKSTAAVPVNECLLGYENLDGALHCVGTPSTSSGDSPRDSKSEASAFHLRHKKLLVTMLNGAGVDYACDDSDGPDKSNACQIICGRPLPCLEPYRLCLAHAECSAISLNSDLSFATLKRSLYSSIAPSATAVTAIEHWRAALVNMSSHFDGKAVRHPQRPSCAIALRCYESHESVGASILARSARFGSQLAVI